MALTEEEKYQYWLSYAQNDMDSAEVMLQSGRWFYTVFMCQQAIEKLVKGLYILYVDDNVSDAHAVLFDTLSQFYLRSRYPDYTSALASLTTSETAQSIYRKSKGAFQWMLTMKP